METNTTPSLRASFQLILNQPIQFLPQSSKNIEQVYQFWKDVYKRIYPKYHLYQEDPFNLQSYILVSRNKIGQMRSSARLTFDGVLGLPDDDVFPDEIHNYRARGMRLLEFGRFVSKEKDHRLLKSYYKAVYQIARAKKIDVIIMVMKDKDIALHQRLMGASLLSKQLKTNNGSQYEMACMAWEIKNTGSPAFRQCWYVILFANKQPIWEAK